MATKILCKVEKIIDMEEKSVLLSDLHNELRQILKFWSDHAVDYEYGGFAGEVDNHGRMVPGAEKGVVLNARILWTFSAAYNFFHEQSYLQLAHRAYDYLVENFWDKENGGLFWAVDYRGQVANSRKQIYGQGFGIYAFSEYFKASQKEESLGYAKDLFRLIEQHSFDPENGGYLEALSINWQPLEDVRLSLKDANSPKSMNTHLHILEPYSNLYRVWKNDTLRNKMIALVRNFLDYILDQETGHFNLFFDKDWTVQSNIVSYGHDIEGVWLLNEAVELINEPSLIKEAAAKTLSMVDAVLKEGRATDHSFYFELDKDTGHLDVDRHWWVQGEAMVGLLDAFKLSGDDGYFKSFQNVWTFVQKYVIDHENGEWHGIVTEQHKPLSNQEKGGFWKCPYHNTRALIECINRIRILTTELQNS